MDRANIIPACVAYLGCVGMSWGDCHETSRPRQDNKFEKWCKESVCLSSTFWESNFSQKRKGWIFQTSLRILYNCKSTFIIIYWDMQKRHVPVFSHKTPTPPDLMLLSSGSLSLVDIKQRRKEHLERMCSPSSNQPVVAACVKFGNVSRWFCVGGSGVFLSNSKNTINT